MALTKDKKSQIVDQISKLLGDSKLTVFADYRGTSVQSMQSLRKLAAQNGTSVIVVKNRLFKKAIGSDQRFKEFDQSILKGQLIYAFNPSDELGPAQALANFAKTQPQIKFVGGLTADGASLQADELLVLAGLPSRDQLRAQMIGTIAAPLSTTVRLINGNLQGILNVLTARAKSSQISN